MARCTRKEIQVGAFFATLMTELLTRCEIVRPARLPAYWTLEPDTFVSLFLYWLLQTSLVIYRNTLLKLLQLFVHDHHHHSSKVNYDAF